MVHDLPSKTFLSQSAESFRRRPLYFFNNFAYRKKLRIRERVIHVFRSKIFCLTMPKNFVGEPFCAVFQKISGIEEIYGEEGGGAYHIFPSKRFCLTVPKIFVGEPVIVS